MIITRKSLPRRTFLRGAGATLSLPFLDAMVPALTAFQRTAAKPVRRLGFIYIPNGVIQAQWEPVGEGPQFEFGRILSPLAPLREYLTVVSGLSHRQAESFGDGNGDHSRATAVWLTGVHAYDRRIREVKLAATVDQIAAQQLGKETRLPSVEILLEGPTQIACDAGDCFYANSISWRTPTTPNVMETHPRAVFERLFGDGGSGQQRLGQMREDHSVLDSVNQEIARLDKTLGASDRTKLVEYTEAVRDVEQRVQSAEARGIESTLALPERPTDIPESFADHAKLMFDLQVLALQADITRVFTIMMAREQSPRTYPGIGVPEQHHAVSHHRSDPEFIEKKAKIDTYHIQTLGYLLERMRSTPDGDGSLLDHAMIMYGGGIGDGNLHGHRNLPCLLAGKGSGQLQGGRHLQCAPETPMSNLLLTLLDKAGIPTPEKIGDSTEHLSGV
jgi:hypothetical protein